MNLLVEDFADKLAKTLSNTITTPLLKLPECPERISSSRTVSESPSEAGSTHLKMQRRELL
jgi:hypothetical protein